DCRDGLAAVRLSLAPGYQGDRVFAFVAGLDSMIMHAYGQKTEFFLFDSVDPQNLYNSARNLEIAAWKLRHDRTRRGSRSSTASPSRASRRTSATSACSENSSACRIQWPSSWPGRPGARSPR